MSRSALDCCCLFPKLLPGDIFSNFPRGFAYFSGRSLFVCRLEQTTIFQEGTKILVEQTTDTDFLPKERFLGLYHDQIENNFPENLFEYQKTDR